MNRVLMKIVHGFVLLVTITALIGINVKQLHCNCLDSTSWKVEILPVEREFSCDEDCCDENSCGEKTCHDETRHDFYRLTDSSLIESDIKVVLYPFDIPELLHSTSLYLPANQVNLFTYKNEIPDFLLTREFLCSYIC